jgi:hypothetical protein
LDSIEKKKRERRRNLEGTLFFARHFERRGDEQRGKKVQAVNNYSKLEWLERKVPNSLPQRGWVRVGVSTPTHPNGRGVFVQAISCRL